VRCGAGASRVVGPLCRCSSTCCGRCVPRSARRAPVSWPRGTLGREHTFGAEKQFGSLIRQVQGGVAILGPVLASFADDVHGPIWADDGPDDQSRPRRTGQRGHPRRRSPRPGPPRVRPHQRVRARRPPVDPVRLPRLVRRRVEDLAARIPRLATQTALRDKPVTKDPRCRGAFSLESSAALVWRWFDEFKYRPLSNLPGLSPVDRTALDEVEFIPIAQMFRRWATRSDCGC
jgi:hypothetical protein